MGGNAVSELPSGGVWWLGMNEATKITTTSDLASGGKVLKAGKYSLWVQED